MANPIQTDDAPVPTGPYSQAIISDRLIFVSGQRPVDPVSNRIPAGIREQTLQVVRNIAAVLVSAGASLADVVKTTVHLADLRDFADFNDVYSEIFHAPYPARTTVGSQLRGILIEVDVIAIKPSS
jgi:2-iminobutanoate/2-iminopropanoate deaminase